MNGGQISHNRGNLVGAGGVINLGTFVMYGGRIINNDGENGVSYVHSGNGGIGGGGIGGVLNRGTFTMHGGTISDNKGGNGVNGRDTTVRNANGGNGGNGGVGGVYSIGTFTRIGGTISGNTGGNGGRGGSSSRVRAGSNGTRGMNDVVLADDIR